MKLYSDLEHESCDVRPPSNCGRVDNGLADSGPPHTKLLFDKDGRGAREDVDASGGLIGHCPAE